MKKIRTSKDLENLIWKNVLEKFSATKTIKETEQLFNNLTTTQEQETIARRLAVLSLISKGISYKSIGEKLWVSPVTISTIKKSALGQGNYKSYHEISRSKLPSNKIADSVKPKQESAFSEWLDYISFLIENPPQISGPRWRFLRYNPTLPKKYRNNGKR